MAQLALIAPEVLDRITSAEGESLTRYKSNVILQFTISIYSEEQSACIWAPEYASYMIEGKCY